MWYFDVLQTNEINYTFFQLFSDVFFTKDFYRGFNSLIKKDGAPIYNYEFKFDGELNACKKLLFATRPIFHSLKGKVLLFIFDF